MRLLVFSNIYIALAAVALTWETYALLGAADASAGLALLVFGGTLFVYNLDRLVSSTREDAVAITERHRWIRERTGWLWALAGLGAAASAASLLWVPLDILWGLVPLGVISLAYSLPVMVRDGQTLRLKDVPGLKIFLIALVWASVTVVLPALDAGVDPLGADALWVLVERLIFVFAIALPFDVRDLERDRKEGIRTLPMMIGAGATRWLAIGLVGVFCVLCALHYGMQPQQAGIPLVANGLLTAAALWASNEAHAEMYYVGLLDGTMIAQGAMVLAWLRWVA